MARFTTRVELHGADESDYNLLHAEMEKRGFERTIKSNDGSTYKLPTAEYNAETEDSIDDVLTAAKSAAAVVKTKGRLSDDASILVTQSAGRKWSKLEPA
jgi:hypothetical protein